MLQTSKAYVNESHILQVNISRLRHKVEPDPSHPQYTLSQPGIGYLLASRLNGQKAQ
jgi:DNA-binding response OmpR family regulator